STDSPESGEDLIELTSVYRDGQDKQRKSPKYLLKAIITGEVFLVEETVKLPESILHILGRNEIQEAIHRTSDPEKFETDLITALSHFIRQTHHTVFTCGIIPVVVKSPTEALIHSRHSKFVVIVLPDSDPTLIRKVRSADGINCQTPVIVISVADILPESTLHMLGRNEIQEAIHRTSDPEKFETDLITALSHFIRQTHRTVDQGLSLLPMPVPVCWSTAPSQYTSALAHPFEHPEGTGLTTGLVNYAPRKPILTQIQDLSEKRFVDQVQESRNLLVSGQTVTQVMNQGLATPKAPPSMGLGTQENSEAVLPGIETLLNAIQVVEGESPATDNEAPCFTKITALNAPDSVKSSSTQTFKQEWCEVFNMNAPSDAN
ncbi:uncharacterized protein LOC113668739, partial [Pocillopora damicornis]|uniref:uncharacterized protein LOC113668739 n=1 Tax=Pocillopora damicornis TaxID=46731 RepID=UPI000F555060